MRSFLTKFSSFHTRYFRSQTGRESQLFLLDHLKTVRPSLCFHFPKLSPNSSPSHPYPLPAPFLHRFTQKDEARADLNPKPARQVAQPQGQHHVRRVHSLLDPEEHHRTIRAAREQDGGSFQGRHPRYVIPLLASEPSSHPPSAGAHQDSVNQMPWLPAPGAGTSHSPTLLAVANLVADDDGSGTTTLIQIFTSLLRESFVPSVHPLEFHFYSAEEGGCLGSGDISRAYVREGKTVRGMMHMCVLPCLNPSAS